MAESRWNARVAADIYLPPFMKLRPKDGPASNLPAQLET